MCFCWSRTTLLTLNNISDDVTHTRSHSNRLLVKHQLEACGGTVCTPENQPKSTAHCQQVVMGIRAMAEVWEIGEVSHPQPKCARQANDSCLCSTPLWHKVWYITYRSLHWSLFEGNRWNKSMLIKVYRKLIGKTMMSLPLGCWTSSMFHWKNVDSCTHTHL